MASSSPSAMQQPMQQQLYTRYWQRVRLAAATSSSFRGVNGFTTTRPRVTFLRQSMSLAGISMSNTRQALGPGAGPSAPAVGGLRFDLLPELCLETIARHLTTGPYHPDPFLDDDQLANNFLQNNPPFSAGLEYPNHGLHVLNDDDDDDGVDDDVIDPMDLMPLDDDVIYQPNAEEEEEEEEEEEVEEEDDDAVGLVAGNNPLAVPVMAGNAPVGGPDADSDNDDEEEAAAHQAAVAAQPAAQQQPAPAAPAGPAAAAVMPQPQQEQAAANVAANEHAAVWAAAAAEWAARTAAAAARAAAAAAAREAATAAMVSFTNVNKEVLRAAKRAAVLARVSPMFGRLSGYLYDIKVDPGCFAAKERAFALDERNRVQWTEERNREDITPERRQELTELLAKPPTRTALADRCPVRTWSRRMVAEMKLHRVSPGFRIMTTDAMERYYLTREELDSLTCNTRPNPYNVPHAPEKPPMRLYRRVDVARLARERNPWVDKAFWDADTIRGEEQERERERAEAAALAAARAPRV